MPLRVSSSTRILLKGISPITDRRQDAYNYRVEAAEAARTRPHPAHKANGDEQRYASDNYAMSFTKGLKHNKDTVLLENRLHFEAFRRAVDEGYIDAFTADVPAPAEFMPLAKGEKKQPDRRKW